MLDEGGLFSTYTIAGKMSDYVVAIPSYERSDRLRTHTLQVLARANIPHHRIYIFIADVPDDRQAKAYHSFKGDGYHVVKGPLGLHRMRNFIHQYFPEGQHILCMDDDIEHIVEMIEDPTVQDRKSCKRYPLHVMDERLDVWAQSAFDRLHEEHASLFGIYPVKNGYFMKSMPAMTTDLRFCVGAVWGMINRQACQLHLEEKEDFERTLWCYQRDRKILRWNHIAPVTRYYKTEGGMQAAGVNRLDAAQKSCQALLRMYPQWCKLYTSKKSGVYEVRLRDHSI